MVFIPRKTFRTYLYLQKQMCRHAPTRSNYFDRRRLGRPGNCAGSFTRPKHTKSTSFFKNGKEAEAYLRTTTHHPFLILCDINMPVMTGLELRATIEADPVLKEKSIPFIFLSTTGNPTVVRNAYSLTV